MSYRVNRYDLKSERPTALCNKTTKESAKETFKAELKKFRDLTNYTFVDGYQLEVVREGDEFEVWKVFGPDRREFMLSVSLERV